MNIISKAALLIWLLCGAGLCQAASFTNFETAHVRPLALSPDGKLLFAVNTPDNRLGIYAVSNAGLSLAAEVPVGMEPCSVAVRTTPSGALEAWVVNFLSDSVSIVSVDTATPSRSFVDRTLLVGDEPRDIVFAGKAGDRAFITAAHRGQNRPGDPQLTTPGVGRADVWTFDTGNLGAAMGGTPLSIIELFGDTPRALAVSPDKSIVYAAVFQSGNRTTTIPATLVSRQRGLPPPPPCPTPDSTGCAEMQQNAPQTGLIVRQNDAGRWLDELGRDWSRDVAFSLPDKDVFLINANGQPPALVSGRSFVNGVGTTLFNMAVRPDNGHLYVSNTEAINQVRFVPMLDSHFVDNRITVIAGTQTHAYSLNPDVDVSIPTDPQSLIDQRIAQPTDMVFSRDGARLYVAAFGSAYVGIVDTHALESGTLSKTLIPVGSGPSGLALDEARDRLYVMNRIGHSISVISHLGDASTRAETQRLLLSYDPSPAKAKNGRSFLYNARQTSGHGTVSCASCHVFGDTDAIAWDLGDPYGQVLPNPNPQANVTKRPAVPYHPMKGPMSTQSLRGMAGSGPMHWRGDKTNGLTGDGQLSGLDTTDANGAFLQFNGAVTDLQGAAQRLSTADMQAFADFALSIAYPPNPVHALNNVDNKTEASGRNRYMTEPDFGGVFTCNDCHKLPQTTTGQLAAAGFTPLAQAMKIPQLRNLYQKVGMFGLPHGLVPTMELQLGDQVRGFGFSNDGSVSTIFDFMHNLTFNFAPIAIAIPLPNTNAYQDKKIREIEQFLLGMDTGLRPIVGQQISLNQSNVADAALNARLSLLLSRADAGDCDLTVKGTWNGEARGALYMSGSFLTDRISETPLSPSELANLVSVPGQHLSFTCVPPGNGMRVAIDRDLDGILDRDELDAGSSPADFTSYPGGPQFATIPTSALRLAGTTTSTLGFSASTDAAGTAHPITAPAAGSAGDPTLGGATLIIYNSAGSGEMLSIRLPAGNWSRSGDSYAYSASQGVTTVQLASNHLDIATDNTLAYPLLAPSQGRMAMRLQLGSAMVYCAEAGAQLSGNPLSPATSDHAGLFVAQTNSAAPASCPQLVVPNT